MNTIKIKFILSTNKWIIAALACLILVVVVILYSIFPKSVNKPDLQNQPTPAKTLPPEKPTFQNDPDAAYDAQQAVRLLETRTDIQERKTFPDGTIEYLFGASFSARPDLAKTSDKEILFQRVAVSPEYPLALSDFTNLYGQPERIIEGPIFYGVGINTYIYAKYGFAIVANPTTNNVLEEQIFSSMTVDNYLQKYKQFQ
ncbi:MAG: hypothetical protein COX78_01550 [Candidatus Levybacteria bacterium CG_4_10_14_0_2_um_filter_35_8]|nr:MAG: hypothetical protein COY68_03040 [Candidatus Levybacteria bacterium CG_4_10_14_0_8_um_filter_35_23]PIZ99703.1 MAG: hypothetical protein COX78_01550 [Candidatus Levybacteria bacterium CG_4_10_14_0_2_um_filter_35_8]